MNNSASNAGRDWNDEVVDSPCPPWCTLAPDDHPFDLNEVNDFEPTHMGMRAVERIKRDGFTFESPTFCLTIEQGTELTPNELDRLAAMLARWRRHLELAQQAQR